MFRFGGGEKLKSVASYTVPAVLAGHEVNIKTDVVESGIPLLLSLKSMKKARLKLDVENDSAEILGTMVPLNNTSSGHYCVPITKVEERSVEEVCAVKLHELNEKECFQALMKLHQQFAHPAEKKLVALLKDAGIWKDEYATQLGSIYQKCELCKLYARTPPRPVVALPMATRFNEKVAIDLKKWGDRWILHLVDMWSRLTVSVLLDRKKPSEVLEKIMTNWIGAGFGVMEAILSDNGGEFSSDETRQVASIWNI